MWSIIHIIHWHNKVYKFFQKCVYSVLLKNYSLPAHECLKTQGSVWKIFILNKDSYLSKMTVAKYVACTLEVVIYTAKRPWFLSWEKVTHNSWNRHHHCHDLLKIQKREITKFFFAFECVWSSKKAMRSFWLHN